MTIFCWLLLVIISPSCFGNKTKEDGEVTQRISVHKTPFDHGTIISGIPARTFSIPRGVDYSRNKPRDKLFSSITSPSSKIESITVKSTDQFGNIVTENIPFEDPNVPVQIFPSGNPSGNDIIIQKALLTTILRTNLANLFRYLIVSPLGRVSNSLYTALVNIYNAINLRQMNIDLLLPSLKKCYNISPLHQILIIIQDLVSIVPPELSLSMQKLDILFQKPVIQFILASENGLTLPVITSNIDKTTLDKIYLFYQISAHKNYQGIRNTEADLLRSMLTKVSKYSPGNIRNVIYSILSNLPLGSTSQYVTFALNKIAKDLVSRLPNDLWELFIPHLKYAPTDNIYKTVKYFFNVVLETPLVPDDIKNDISLVYPYIPDDDPRIQVEELVNPFEIPTGHSINLPENIWNLNLDRQGKSNNDILSDVFKTVQQLFPVESTDSVILSPESTGSDGISPGHINMPGVSPLEIQRNKKFSSGKPVLPGFIETGPSTMNEFWPESIYYPGVLSSGSTSSNGLLPARINSSGFFTYGIPGSNWDSPGRTYVPAMKTIERDVKLILNPGNKNVLSEALLSEPLGAENVSPKEMIFLNNLPELPNEIHNFPGNYGNLPGFVPTVVFPENIRNVQGSNVPVVFPGQPSLTYSFSRSNSRPRSNIPGLLIMSPSGNIPKLQGSSGKIFASSLPVPQNENLNFPGSNSVPGSSISEGLSISPPDSESKLQENIKNTFLGLLSPSGMSYYPDNNNLPENGVTGQIETKSRNIGNTIPKLLPEQKAPSFQGSSRNVLGLQPAPKSVISIYPVKYENLPGNNFQGQLPTDLQALHNISGDLSAGDSPGLPNELPGNSVTTPVTPNNNSTLEPVTVSETSENDSAVGTLKEPSTDGISPPISSGNIGFTTPKTGDYGFPYFPHPDTVNPPTEDDFKHPAILLPACTPDQPGCDKLDAVRSILSNQDIVAEIINKKFKSQFNPNRISLLLNMIKFLVKSKKLQQGDVTIINEFLKQLKEDPVGPILQPHFDSLIVAMMLPENDTEKNYYELVQRWLLQQNLFSLLGPDFNPTPYKTKGELLRYLLQYAMGIKAVKNSTELLDAMKYYLNKINTTGNGGTGIDYVVVKNVLVTETVDINAVVRAVDRDKSGKDRERRLFQFFKDVFKPDVHAAGFNFTQYKEKGAWLKGLFEHLLKQNSISSSWKSFLKEMIPFVRLDGIGAEPLEYVN